MEVGVDPPHPLRNRIARKGREVRAGRQPGRGISKGGKTRRRGYRRRELARDEPLS